MDWAYLRAELQRHDLLLFKLGDTAVMVSTLLKLVVLGLLLYLVAGRLSRWTLARLLRRAHMEPGQRDAITSLVHYAVLVIGTVVILQNVGINLTAFAVVASALGVGLGFGLQNVISNFVSGLIVMLERPFEVGHRIELGPVEGVVRHIGARRTTVVTADRVAILVPNQRFITDNLTNYNHVSAVIRLRVPLTVAADSDLQQVRALMLQAAAQVPLVSASPAPDVALTSIGAASLGFELHAWYDGRAHAKQEVLSALHYALAAALKAQGVKLA